jgi:hypothetical protein
MSTFQEQYDAALLAHAAYLNFPGVSTPGSGAITGSFLKAILIAVDEHGTVRFTEEQADYFVSRFKVVAFRDSGDTSFQAAVFQDLAPSGPDAGRLTIAFRGTEDRADVGQDLALALLGAAITQEKDSEEFLADLRSTGTGGFGLITAGMQVNFAGHSLGGHLAYHAEQFGGVSLNTAYTFNTAGNGRSPSTIWRAITGADAPAFETILAEPGFNLVGSFATGFTPGTDLEIFTEPQQPGSLQDYWPANHYMQPIVDSLAVYRVLEVAAPLYSLDNDVVARVISGATDKRWDSLEATLNVIAALYGATPIALAPGLEPDDSGRRDALHRLAGDLVTAIAADVHTRELKSLVDMSADARRRIGRCR